MEYEFSITKQMVKLADKLFADGKNFMAGVIYGACDAATMFGWIVIGYGTVIQVKRIFKKK